MKNEIKGRPFYDEKTNIAGVYVSENNDGTKTFVYCKREEDPNIYRMSRNNDRLRQINAIAYNVIPVNAKIISIEASINEFGNAQRRKDFAGSSLKIIDYYKNDNGKYAFVLLTGRKDGVKLRMLPEDIKLMLPTITHINRDLVFIYKGDTVRALKDNVCGFFKRGDHFKVLKVSRNTSSNRLDQIFINDDNGNEIVSYAKNFKIVKTK